MDSDEQNESERVVALCSRLGRLTTEQQIEVWDDAPAPETPLSQIPHIPLLPPPPQTEAATLIRAEATSGAHTLPQPQEVSLQRTSVHSALIPVANLELIANVLWQLWRQHNSFIFRNQPLNLTHSVDAAITQL